MRRILLGLAAGVATLVAEPATARACGGFFCDTGPQAMAVNQTGENIIFVTGDGYVDAHIQIQYDPRSTAPDFAWVVPVTAVPELSVGSGPLFDALMDASVPTFSRTPGETCGGATGGGTGAAFLGSPDGGAVDDPDIVLQETVGAFEVVVLDGGTVDSVMQWLADNGYQQDPAAAPILGEYLAEGFLFAAFKLANGADVSEVHPVVLRIPGGEPCVPLRLTRIAAEDDMDVRVMFLAERQMVSTNYRHLRLNPVMLDWAQLGANYREAVARAVDEAQEDGHAFVTEFAGGYGVDPASVSGETWDEQPFMGAAVVDVVDILAAQGLVSCAQDVGCDFLHPLVRGLLLKYVPVPAGVEEGPFYACLSCFQGQIDAQAWDGPAFAADFSERIVDPGIAATEALFANPVLTRLYTRISPVEMTEDPVFHPHPTAEPDEVSNLLEVVVDAPCDVNGQVYRLPGKREVFVPPGPWPDIDGMPWLEEAEQNPFVGPPQTVVDNSDLIDTLLAEHNAAHGWPPGGDDSGGDGGDEGGSTSGSGSTSGGAGEDGVATASCACSGGTSGPAVLALPGLVLFRARRRFREGRRVGGR